jgi:hypothetical protein
MRQTGLGLFPTLERILKEMSASIKPRKNALVFVVVTNLLVVSLYLYFASWIWAPPEDQGLYGGPGDPIIWAFLAFPCLAAGVFTNIVVIPRIANKVFYHKDLRLLFVWGACVFVFISAFEYDRSRQYNGSLVSQDRFAPPGQPSHGAQKD